ncbi:MAG: hypothetical protein RL199_365, partial [Pseudomonadota bacterium]
MSSEPTKSVSFSYRRYGYGSSVSDFLTADVDAVLGELTRKSAFDVDKSQILAWRESIDCLRGALYPWAESGHVYLEFDVPRLGRRIDAVLVIRHVIFVVEFKVGARSFLLQDIDQVVDYVLDLKYFHDTSHSVPIAPVLVATAARSSTIEASIDSAVPGLLRPLRCTPDTLQQGVSLALELLDGSDIVPAAWERGRYRPTPTIVEAAIALYAKHSVADISRSDASNLSETSGYVSELIETARVTGRKCICFVTGVPGAGKTLVGLDVATRSTNIEAELHAVYLSGNGPLVQVLQEALARYRVRREAEHGRKLGIGEAR